MDTGSKARPGYRGVSNGGKMYCGTQAYLSERITMQTCGILDQDHTMYNNSMPGGKQPVVLCLPGRVWQMLVRSLWKAFFAAVYLLNCVQIFCVSMDCSPPGFSVQKTSQARILSGWPFSLLRVIPDSKQG